jgi:NAD(P)-dependent dehydrogenase (short-subunit alcohol dehydrogenase family)
VHTVNFSQGTYMTALPLNKRTALVTGGAGGIGAAAAERFARDGASVVIADANEQGAQLVAADLREKGLSAVGVRCDQTSESEVAALFDRAFPHGLDICFANAGWGTTAPFVDVSLSDWRKTFDINVAGTFLICQAAAKRMIAGGRGGSIIVTSSTGAMTPGIQFSAYCAAKAALNMMVKVMALELGPHDIRVNAVMPGVTATSMTGPLLKTRARDLVEFDTPLGRLAQPEDIADAVAFLAGANSAYVTGTALLIDGGGTLNAAQWFATDNRRRGEVNWQLAYKHRRLDAAATEVRS